jgi:thioredoxin 1
MELIMAREIVGKDQMEKEVLTADVPVLVDFHAPWCAPCRQLGPVIDELAETVQGARVVKMNVDDNRELAIALRISSIPALVFFKDGKEVRRHVGVRSKRELLADLEQLK